MESLSEEFKRIMANRPDAYTIAWWNEQLQEVKKGYRGATHAINRAIADHADRQKAIDTFAEKLAELEARSEEDRAAIGALRQAVAGMTERIDRMAEFCKSLKK